MRTRTDSKHANNNARRLARKGWSVSDIVRVAGVSRPEALAAIELSQNVVRFEPITDTMVDVLAAELITAIRWDERCKPYLEILEFFIRTGLKKEQQKWNSSLYL